MISLRQVRQFLAVAETMSFRQAAIRLNMAQPPLTAAIRQIEDDLGVVLFERTNRITALTEAGETFRVEGIKLIEQAERTIVQTRRTASGSVGLLRIGFVANSVRSIIPPILSSFRSTHPNVVLELLEATTARQIKMLLRDELDVCVVAMPLPPQSDGRVDTYILLSGHFIVAVPERHTLGSVDHPLRLVELENEPWILFPAEDGPGLHGKLMACCSQAGFVPRVAQRAIQMDTIVGLVAAGLGVALVPSVFSGAMIRGVSFRPLTGPGTPVPYQVALAWGRSNTSPLVKALCEDVRANTAL